MSALQAARARVEGAIEQLIALLDGLEGDFDQINNTNDSYADKVTNHSTCSKVSIGGRAGVD